MVKVALVMAATNPVQPARQLHNDTVIEERIESQGRAWLWREGASVIDARYRSVSEQVREQLRSLFLRKLVVAAEKRGITAESFAAATPPGMAAADVRWMRWHREGEGSAPLWALFVQSRVLSCTEADNDTWMLVAWGDGPVLAWASNEAGAQACLRAALHAPPTWLHQGMASRDPAFCVRIEPWCHGARGRKPSNVHRDARMRSKIASDAVTEPKASVRSILAAWRRAHPARATP